MEGQVCNTESFYPLGWDFEEDNRLYLEALYDCRKEEFWKKEEFCKSLSFSVNAAKAYQHRILLLCRPFPIQQKNDRISKMRDHHHFHPFPPRSLV